ncbi:ABC transporter permease [Jiangella asiatica]|uniref:ABC transporter permease n=1 Tax=Jiangella asiatica TaxID=2530372 RepID=A0A4R5DBV5_9ACTN|nr:ABC transporter permease [Jiangella asiatica]TDE11169.1 ABC transporter permease [Jiangella asiatica]
MTRRGTEAAPGRGAGKPAGRRAPVTTASPRPGALVQIVLKLLRLVAVLVVVGTLVFLSMELLPGGPAEAMLGVSATPDSIAALERQLGLDQRLLDRYLSWLGGVLRGDLGQSFRNGQDVSTIVADRLSVTIELVVAGQLIALLMALPLAMISANRRGSVLDRGVGLFVFSVLSTPHFVIGVVLIWLLSVNLGWLPATGYMPISAGVGTYLSGMIMPAVALAAAPFAQYQRVLRADLIETNNREFMLVARAKGVSPLRTSFRHALRPSLLGLSTVVGITIGTSIGSSVVVETLFGLPGLGAELVSAVQARDYPEVQGIVLVVAAAFVVVNAIVDVLYSVIDPRLRQRRRTRREALT